MNEPPPGPDDWEIRLRIDGLISPLGIPIPGLGVQLPMMEFKEALNTRYLSWLRRVKGLLLVRDKRV